MRAPRVLAVDIGAGHVACGVFSVGAAGRLVLQQFALEPHSSDPTHEGRWAVEIAQSLGAVVARHRLSGPAALAVPGHLALTKFVKTPSVAKEKRGKIVAFEATENIPYPLEEVVWDHAVVSDDGFDLEVMLAAVKFDAMQSLCAAAEAAGFPVERATPASLALYRSYRYNYPEKKEPAIVVNVGARTTNVLFVDRLQLADYGGYAKSGGTETGKFSGAGDRFYVRSLALAGNAVTQAIAEELRIDFASAETLKIQVLSGKSDLPANSPSRAAVQKAAQAFAARLQMEVMRSVVNHRRHTGGGAPESAYLTGGGSLIEELPALLGEKLHLPVERYRSLKNVDLSADARASGADAAAPVLADLVGMATALVAKDEPDASLLPPGLVAALEFRKRQPRYVAAAALGALALLPPPLYFHHLASNTQAEIAQYDSQLMPLRSVQNRNEENLRQIEELTKQLRALRGAYETKANWINFLADLQERLVDIGDVWIDKISVERPPLPEPGTVAEVPPEPPPPGPDGAPGVAPEQPPVPKGPPLRLKLTGRLLDVKNPQSKVSAESLQQVKRLLGKFTSSQFITAVENERFDTTQNGLLRFDFTLVINPKKTL